MDEMEAGKEKFLQVVMDVRADRRQASTLTSTYASATGIFSVSTCQHEHLSARKDEGSHG